MQSNSEYGSSYGSIYLLEYFHCCLFRIVQSCLSSWHPCWNAHLNRKSNQQTFVLVLLSEVFTGHKVIHKTSEHQWNSPTWFQHRQNNCDAKWAGAALTCEVSKWSSHLHNMVGKSLQSLCCPLGTNCKLKCDGQWLQFSDTETVHLSDCRCTACALEMELYHSLFQAQWTAK